MIIARKEDLVHKFQLLRLLTAIVDSQILSQNIYFKGGTCAAMAGFLDRFSVDLDFDIKEKANSKIIREELEKVFKGLDLTIENLNQNSLFFVLKYKANTGERNSLKLSIYEDIIEANIYKPTFLVEINRLVNCQTIETMFANKLVAPIDRYKKHQKIAGRDIYDIYYFFLKGYRFREEIIQERTGLEVEKYIKELTSFVEEKITENILTEDLSTLLPYDKFKKIRKTLKQDVLLFLKMYSRGVGN